MSEFICGETGLKIPTSRGETIYAGGRNGSKKYILSSSVVKAVPKSLRLYAKRSDCEDGFDIFCYKCPQDFPPENFDDLVFCGHYFSVDGKTAKQYFPAHYEEYFC
ncbi:MAG: hypothetical protein ACOCUR_01735 [Nanoarchaeota archaeon]